MNPQNSAPAAGGRPRAEAHDHVAASIGTAASTETIARKPAAETRRSLLRTLWLLHCTANIRVTVGKLALSPPTVTEVKRMHVKQHPFLIFSLAVIAACSGRDRSSAQAVGDTVGAAHRAAIIKPSTIPYASANIANPGAITGEVTFLGNPPADTAVIVPADQNGCGKPLSVQLLMRTNGKVGNVVVWLTDVRRGKALPLERRFQLTNDNCAWDPQVQTTVTGGALNVVNYDPLAERAFATDVSTGDTVAIAPFTDDGQVIPYDRLLQQSRVLEFSVESRPMSRAWVVVLDQPYFAITDSRGAFRIEGVPPGTHQIRAWHPMLGVTDGSVTVAANGTATVNLSFK